MPIRDSASFGAGAIHRSEPFQFDLSRARENDHFDTWLSLVKPGFVASRIICCQHKKKSRAFLRGEARRNEGADASHEGVADHLQRSISSNMFILRRYARSGAVDMREMVFFVICSLPRFHAGKARDDKACRGC